MTTARIERCRHCGQRYTHQTSGYGCGHPLNSGTYCPDCKAIEIEALRKAFADVPRLFECRYQDVKEIPDLAWVTLEQVLEWEKTKGGTDDLLGVPMQRIWMPRFDLETPDSQNTREVKGLGDAQGYRFRVMTWRKKPEHTIEVPREYDLIEQRFTGSNWPRHIRKPDPRFVTEPLTESALHPPRAEEPEGK